MPDNLETFMQGMTAAAFLFNRAVEKRSALECLVLQANIIDGCLRIGLILKQQLDTCNAAVDQSLLRQKDEDPRISERDIFQRALNSGVIDGALHRTLSEAYEKRNKCIHRYLLCSIDYDYVAKLVFELDHLLDQVRDQISRLEQEQICRGVGMTVEGSETTKEQLRDFALRKERPYNLG